jgi:hypothetical protein
MPTFQETSQTTQPTFRRSLDEDSFSYISLHRFTLHMNSKSLFIDSILLLDLTMTTNGWQIDMHAY